MCTRSFATVPLATILATLLALTSIAAWSPVLAQDPTTAEASAEPTEAPAPTPARPAIVIDAENSFYDLRSGGVRFEDDVSITRGAMDVQADRGFMRQQEGQITEVELQGAPATWSDQLEDGSIVSGEAGTIFFDVIANVVTLTGNAVIRHEQGEFTGDELVYDLNAESLAGRSTGDERVRVVIEPEAMSSPITPPPSSDPVNEDSTAEGAEEPPAEESAADAETVEDTPAGEAEARDEVVEEPPVAEPGEDVPDDGTDSDGS